MKKNILFSLALIMLLGSCSKEDGINDDLSFLNSASSSNVTTAFDISDDNSGNVTITPSGEGVSTYMINYGDPNAPVAAESITPGNSLTHSYPEGSYTVTVIAYDLAGKPTTTTYPLQLTYRAPENVTINIGSDMTVGATALYANSFLVYYGDVPNEVGTPMAVGQTLPAHVYPAGGPYTMRVIANSGGAATTTIERTLFGFPLSFEHATMNYFFGTFGNVVFSKVANPAVSGINTSATVGKYDKPVGAESWSGTYSPLDIPMNMAHGKKVKMMVYNPDPANIGKLVNVELEAAVVGTGATDNGVAVLKMPITTSGAWEELTFDFAPIAAIGPNARFNQLVLRFNDAAGGAGETIYIDNIRITN